MELILLAPLIFGCLVAVVIILRGYVAWSFANDPHTKFDDAFEHWYYDECHIAAAELVGPNSIEYDRLVDKLLDDDGVRKAAARKFYDGMDRHETADR